MTYLDRAIKDGYAIITGPENKQKIIYVTSDTSSWEISRSFQKRRPIILNLKQEHLSILKYRESR